MTRKPAPADDAAMDLALCDAAEQWRLDFEVPPMPLLDSDSQRRESRPVAVSAPRRSRWTRPVLVAASIVALGALTTAVISVARPTDRVAGPTPSAPTISAPPTTSNASASPSSSRAAAKDVWPAQGLLSLDVIEGTPPTAFTVGATTYTLSGTETPADVVIDSDRPAFLSVRGSYDVGSSCGSVTRVYLQRKEGGAIAAMTATYGFAFTQFACGGPLLIGGSVYGSAPYPLAGIDLVSAVTGAAVPVTDLADYRPPLHLPPGYTLGLPFTVSAGGRDRNPASEVSRQLIAESTPGQPKIRLIWRILAAPTTSAPVSASQPQANRCATRVLDANETVTACVSANDPQPAVSTAELQRVVDSIPNRPADRVAGPSVSGSPTALSTSPITSSSAAVPALTWPATNTGDLVIAEGAPPPTITVDGVVLTLGSTGGPTSLIIDSDHPEFLSVSGRNDPRPCKHVTRVFLDRTDGGAVTVTSAKYSPEYVPGQLCTADLPFDQTLQGNAPFPIANRTLLAPGSDTELQKIDLGSYRAPQYVPTGYAPGPDFMMAPAWESSPFGSKVNRVLRAHDERLKADIWLTWRDSAVDTTAAPEPSMQGQMIRCASKVLGVNKAVTACVSAIDPQQAVSTAELQRVVDSIPN